MNAKWKEREPEKTAAEECEPENTISKQREQMIFAMENNVSIPLRPHHGMCLAYYEGKGYSDGFTAHMQNMLDFFLEKDQNGEDTRVRLVTHPDEICSACPNCERKGIPAQRSDSGTFRLMKEGCKIDLCGRSCRDEEKVRRYDCGVLEMCGLEEGKEVTFGEFTFFVQERILSAGRRAEICRGCQWESICSSGQSRWEKQASF